MFFVFEILIDGIMNTIPDRYPCLCSHKICLPMNDKPEPPLLNTKGLNVADTHLLELCERPKRRPKTVQCDPLERAAAGLFER